MGKLGRRSYEGDLNATRDDTEVDGIQIQSKERVSTVTTLWGEPADLGTSALTTHSAKVLEQYRLYLGSLRIHKEQLVFVTAIDRESGTAKVVPIEEASLVDPSWWLTNVFDPQQSLAPWDALESIPVSIANQVQIWPPLPILISGLVPDFPLPDELRKFIPALLAGLSDIGSNKPGTHDTFLVVPQLRGAPVLAWHRNGRCIAGFQVEFSETPNDVHDKSCAKRETGVIQRRSTTNTKAFQSYTTESQRIYEEIAQPSVSSPNRPARLIKIYANAKCACASLSFDPHKAGRISIDATGNVREQVRQRLESFLSGTLAISEQKSNRRWANQHARRIVRYGVTELRKQPPKISKAAKLELARLSTSTRPTVIRFGPAGSGKTSILALVAARLSWLGRRVAIVTFTSASKNVIESRIENETIADRSMLAISTILELAPRRRKRQVIADAMAQKRQLSSQDFTNLMFTGRHESLEDEEEVSTTKVHRLFDALLVDEAEDFTTEMWNFLLGDDLGVAWEEGKNLQQVFVTFDDAQAALDGGKQKRTFEQQAPQQWTKNAFSGQPGAEKVQVRSQFTNLVDFAWLKFNLRQASAIASTSTSHRSRFRKNDPVIEVGYEDAGLGSVEEIRIDSLTQLLEYLAEQSRNVDTLLVLPDRLMVAVATLWLDFPGQFVTQSEFLDDTTYQYADERGDRAREGIWFEAPIAKTRIYLPTESRYEAVKPYDMCAWAHRKLWELDRSSKSSVRPTDIRTRILTYPAARGHEAETAIIVVPADGSISAEQLYIGLSRAQKKLIKLVVPPWKELLASDDSSAGRLVRILQLLKVGVPTTEAVWPRLQVDLWRWQRTEGLKYLETAAIEKVLDWYQQIENELEKEPTWQGLTHCLDEVFPTKGGLSGSTPGWRNYNTWIKRLKNFKEAK